jgi:hypothetical protein
MKTIKELYEHLKDFRHNKAMFPSYGDLAELVSDYEAQNPEVTEETEDEPEESEEGEICHHCNGSGEGMTDGSCCWYCKGSGDEPGESNDDDFDVPDEPDFPENYQGDF